MLHRKRNTNFFTTDTWTNDEIGDITKILDNSSNVVLLAILKKHFLLVTKRQ